MVDRFDKFTERARRVLALAQEEAQRFNHTYIGTEHFLLGLVREGDGIAARVLSNFGVQLPQVRAAVEARIGRGETRIRGEIGLTPRAKKVVELAVDEARRLNHHYIGTEHLLLGLVREGEGIAAEVLRGLGIELNKVTAQVIQVLSHAGGTSGESRPPVPPHRLGTVRRALPVNIDGGRATVAITLNVALQELDLYDHGFVAHLRVDLGGALLHLPAFVAMAEDDRGGRYQGQHAGGTGGDGPEGFAWRVRSDFTPALDPSARSLTMTFTIGRRRGAEVIPADPPVSWTFDVPLPAEGASPGS